MLRFTFNGGMIKNPGVTTYSQYSSRRYGKWNLNPSSTSPWNGESTSCKYTHECYGYQTILCALCGRSRELNVYGLTVDTQETKRLPIYFFIALVEYHSAVFGTNYGTIRWSDKAECLYIYFRASNPDPEMIALGDTLPCGMVWWK